jgi:hypothetical protein
MRATSILAVAAALAPAALAAPFVSGGSFFPLLPPI